MTATPFYFRFYTWMLIFITIKRLIRIFFLFCWYGPLKANFFYFFVSVSYVSSFFQGHLSMITVEFIMEYLTTGKFRRLVAQISFSQQFKYMFIKILHIRFQKSLCIFFFTILLSLPFLSTLALPRGSWVVPYTMIIHAYV